jgi:glutathione S-transferase
VSGEPREAPAFRDTVAMARTGAEPAAAPGASSTGAATLYVISGSHACTTAKLTLRHKAIPFRIVTLPTGAHPLLVRLRGFGGGQAHRTIDGGSTRASALMDRLGTVPALEIDGTRVQTNLEITRHLDTLVPEPPLFPADAQRREAVEDAERWGDQELQMLARRIVLAAGARDLAELSDRGARGRLGPLLAGNGTMRSLSGGTAARLIFRASGQAERDQLDALPPALDRADRLLAEGVIGAEPVNAADLMIAPSLALLDYRLDVRGELRGRPCFALVERLLPEAPAAPS